MVDSIRATLNDILEASKYVTSYDRWFEISGYNNLTVEKGYKLCSFSPSYGRYKGYFCGNRAIFTNKGVDNYRCEECYDKIGKVVELKEEIPSRWFTPEIYFASYGNNCSFTPKEGDNFGYICGLPAIRTECHVSDYRCKLCLFKESDKILFDEYYQSSREQASKRKDNKRKLTEERWVTTESYIKSHIKNQNIFRCSYSPKTGDKRNLHCYNEAVTGERGSFWEYRCKECKSKKGRNTTSIFISLLLPHYKS